MRLLIGLHIAFFLLYVNNCCTQQFNAKSYSFPEGLLTYNIKKTVQDKYGFIWVATQDGVFRHDGTSFEAYKKTSGSSGSLRENFIFDIALDNNENLYVASFNGGVDVINVRTQQVTHLLSQKKEQEEGLPDLWITKIFCDGGNNLWIGGQNYLRIYDLEKKKYKEFEVPSELGTRMPVSFIRPVNKDQVAVGIEKYGILFYDASLKIEEKLTTLYNESNLSFSDLAIINDSCYISSSSVLFSGSITNGKWKTGRKIELPGISGNLINCLAGNKTELWIGTNNGIGEFDLATGKFAIIDNNEFINTDNFIYDLFIDKENGLWISSLKNLVRLNLFPSPFYSFKGNKDNTIKLDHIYSLVPVSNDQVFACGSDGLYLCNITTHDVKKIKGTAALDIIHYVLKMDDDLWLISSSNGMYGYQPRSGVLSKELLLNRYPEWKPFINNYFNNTVRSGNKIYWASEEQEGLVIWQPGQHLIKQYKTGEKNPAGVPEDHIHNIKFDKDGYIWLLADNSVAKFDPVKDSVVQVINYHHTIGGFTAGIFFDMYDDDSVLWFGTYGGGINGYNKKTKQWTYFTEEDGLCNNAVYGILPERDSIFWVSTNNGLSRINYKTRKCINFFSDDGLHDNSFDEKGALAFGNKLFFAGVNGFTIIDPARYYSSSTGFPVYIKKIEYSYRNEKVVLNDLTWNKLKLPPGTTHATIWLSALSFTNNKPRFSYKIKGFQDEYLPAGDKNKIELNALKRGQYNIDIRYINEKGEFIENAIGVNLEILPYWYQTVWFRTIVALTAALAVLFVIRLVHLSRLRKQRIALEKQIAIQMERQRISSEMHDDIGAGLSGIKLLTEMTRGKIKDDVAGYEIDKIYRSVGDISAKMKEVIWSLNTENDQLSSLISYIQRQARQWLENYPAELTINLPGYIPDVEISGDSRRNIFLVVKEAVHNIIKHSGASKVNISISCNGNLKISISDNGRGIHNDENGFTGNGLRNMRQRMEQLNGKFFMEKNEGLSLTFEIPIKHTYDQGSHHRG